ncbi:MAG TPA: exodeoxyribonuclease VII large subunit, partial [Candidatus Bipolaricaulis anaerobius]|nr:exodeoxyribonuclease VII large subunit [Candidatus Bipolaricaulis anaerobius]
GRGANRDLSLAHQRVSQVTLLVPARARMRLVWAGERLEGHAQRLHALDPRRVVERGYAIVRLAEGPVVTDPRQAPPQALLRLQLKRGTLRARSEGEEGGE